MCQKPHKDPQKSRKKDEEHQDQVDILRSEKEGFGTIAEGYNTHQNDESEKDGNKKDQ